MTGPRNTLWMNRVLLAGVAGLVVLALFLFKQPANRQAALESLRLSRSRQATEAFKHPFDNLVGQPAPNLTLTSFDGKQIQVSGFKGNTVVFFFSLDYCPPCQAELSALQQLLRDHPRNIRVIGVARQLSGREITPEQLQSRLSALNAGFPIVMDDSSIDKFFGNIKVVPVTIYIDSSSTLTKQSLSQNYQDISNYLLLR